MSDSDPRRPLRVVELSEQVAGAVCGRLFAGLGHDVVRGVMSDDDTDALRHRPPLNAEGVSLSYTTLHAGKRSVAAAAEPDRLTTAMRTLIDGADVLVLDLVPGRAAALGVHPDRLCAAWPNLVVVWITGFGSDSEFSELPASSLLAESLGGMATMIGEAGRRPLHLGGDQTAYCGAVTGFLGALLALLRRDQGRGGDLVEVAMCDVAAYMDWKSDVSYFMTGVPPRRAARDEGDWRLVRASDGWVGFIFLPRHWPAVVELVDEPALRSPDLADEATRRAHPERWWPVVERWASALPAEMIYERAQGLGLPFGWVVRISDLLRSDQLRSRGFINLGPEAAAGRAPAVNGPLHGDGIGWRHTPEAPVPSSDPKAEILWRPRPAAASDHPALTRTGDAPMTGLVVLDFGTITAGAAVTRLLADYGATILKVEWPERPDTFRTWKLDEAEMRSDADVTSPYFPSNNVGKLDVAIDLKTAEGRHLVHRLARHAHVVVENFRVGVTDRLGIDAATLRAVNPDLVYLSLSSQGQHGPESGNRSFGSTLDLLSGLASLTGYAGGEPMWSSYEVNYPDQLVSLVGAAAAAYCVQQGITGIELDISQREVVSWTLATEISDYLVNGRDSTVTGNRRPGLGPHDTFPTASAETWVAVSCETQAQRVALATWLGRNDLGDADEAWWAGEEAYEVVSAATRRLHRRDLIAQLEAAGVPAVPVLTAADRAVTPRFGKRRVTITDDGPPVKGFPMTFRSYEPDASTTAPAIGEHTWPVLTELAGIAEDELRKLSDAGVVQCAAPRVATPAGQKREGTRHDA